MVKKHCKRSQTLSFAASLSHCMEREIVTERTIPKIEMAGEVLHPSFHKQCKNCQITPAQFRDSSPAWMHEHNVMHMVKSRTGTHSESRHMALVVARLSANVLTCRTAAHTLNQPQGSYTLRTRT